MRARKWLPVIYPRKCTIPNQNRAGQPHEKYAMVLKVDVLTFPCTGKNEYLDNFVVKLQFVLINNVYELRGTQRSYLPILYSWMSTLILWPM